MSEQEFQQAVLARFEQMDKRLERIEVNQVTLSENQVKLNANQMLMMDKLDEIIELAGRGWLTGQKVIPIDRSRLEIVQ